MRPRLGLLMKRTERFYNSSYFMISCIFVLFLLNQFCFLLLEVPRVRLFERVICAHYYQTHHHQKQPALLLSNLAKQQLRVRYAEDDEEGIVEINMSTLGASNKEEELCKLPEIQMELATVFGIKTALDAMPGLLTASYFGSLADRIGRRPVALLSSIGELLALLSSLGICTRWSCFSFMLQDNEFGFKQKRHADFIEDYFQATFGIRFVWLSSLSLFAGGGIRIFLSMLFSLIADTVSSRLRYVLFWVEMIPASLIPYTS